MYGVVRAVFYADVAASAVFRFDDGLGRAVQFQLAADAGATHAEVLQRTAESGLFVSFEMGHRDDNVCVGDGRADFRCFAVFAVDFDFPVVDAFQSVGNDDLTLCGDRVVAVLHSAL